MTLNTDIKNWLATNAGSAGCFATSGVAYTDPDGVARTGSTGDVANAFLVAHLIGKDTAVIIAATTYTALKVINGNTDLSVDDISWVYNNSYCAVVGTPTPTPTPRPRNYPPIGGLKFSGSDYVDCGNKASLNINGELSVEIWISGIDPTNRGGIAAKWAAASHGYLIWNDLGTIRWVLNTGTRPSTPAPTDSRMHQIVATFKGTTAVLMLDGTIVDTKTDNTLAPSTDNLYIGSYNGAAVGVKGLIAIARVYNRALSQTEAISNMTGNITRTGLVMEHIYTDGNARDQSGNGNDGTIHGAVFILPTPAPTPTPSPKQGFVGAFQFQSAPDLPAVVMDLSSVTLQQSTSRDLHLMINQVKITNVTPLNVYIAAEVRLFPGSQTSCPSSGQDFQGMDRTSTKNARIVLLSPGETGTLNMDFYQSNIVGMHSICLYIHGTYVRADLEAEILPITG